VILSDDGWHNNYSVAKYSKASCKDSMVDLDRRVQPHESSVVDIEYASM
jgi:hypothetical protein